MLLLLLTPFTLFLSFCLTYRIKFYFFPILGEPVSVSVTVFIEFIGDIDEINMV